MGSVEPAQKMRVKEIRVYPIKSLRGVSLHSQRTTTKGFEYDRIFMLQCVEGEKPMHVPNFPSMCLFTTELLPPENPTKVFVRFKLDHTFDKVDQKLPQDESVLEIPLNPDVSKLERRPMAMHLSPTVAFVMPPNFCKWFTDRFGFEVRLLYIGLNKRPVLGNVNPNSPRTYVGDPGNPSLNPNGGWFDGIKTGLGNIMSTVATYTGMDSYTGVEDGLTFADCAAFLVVNYRSHIEAQNRVGEEIDPEKFRPNIVIDGAESAWEEDYWAEIAIGLEDRGTRIALTSNCGRCGSLNVDYETGRPGKGATGNVLKSLMRDRRVDPGHKFAPIFGRYGFLSSRNGIRPQNAVTIQVGDEVQITKLNEKRTHFYWPE